MPRNLSKKRAEIAAYESMGPYRYPFRNGPASGEIVARLAAASSETELLLLEGEWRGEIELAASLLYPRLLIWAWMQPDPSQPLFGRDFARATGADGRDGLLWLVSRDRKVGIQVR